MDLRGYTTVDEVGEDTQVRNVENFRPTTAAEEIEYLNKILENMENYNDSGENSKSEIPELENAVSESDPHSNHTYNNNALDLITEVCSDMVNVEISKSACDQNFVREECSEKLEHLSEICTINETLEKEKSHCDEVDIKEYGLPCADDILTQAKNQHSVIQDIKSGHVQNELSTEPNLIMADPAIPDVEDHFRQSPDCTQSNFSPNAELEEKLEAHSIEPVSSDAPNETGSSELSSSTKEATIMPVNCSAESSSVLESRHYSAKETFDFISGEDVSESSTLDSLELGDVSSLSNVVLGDIRSLLESSADQPNVTAENTPAEYETHIDLSIVKSEPDCTDPGEDFNLKDFCSDPGEEFVLNEHSIKEEPLEDSPPAPTMNQEEVLLPVKIFKSEDDGSDEQVIMPNIRYLVDEKKQYSREEVAAALIISQSSLSSTIDMEMFQNLGKTMLAVSSSRLEDMFKSPERLTLEDFNVVQLFRSTYGSSLQEWKASFKLRTNYSAKHTAKKKAKEQIDNAPTEKKKGRRGRKKKCETEMGNSDVSIKGEKVEKEGREHSDYEFKKIHRESTKVFPLKEEGKLEKGIKEETSIINEDLSKETITPKAKKGKRGRKKKSLMEEPSVIERTEVKNETDKENESGDCALNQTNDECIQSMPFKDDAEQLVQGMVESEHISECESELMSEDDSHKRKRNKSLDQIDDTERKTNAEVSKDENTMLKSEYEDNEFETIETSQQMNLPVKGCYIHLYDIAKDATYGMIVRKYLKESSEKRFLQHCVEESLKEKSTEYVKSHQNFFSDDSSDESFTGFSPVRQREDSMSIGDEDLVADEDNKDLFSEIEPREFSRKDKAAEKSLTDVVTIGKKVELNQSKPGDTTEIRAKHRNEVEAEIKLSKEYKGEKDIKKEVDSQTEKDERRTKKKLKLDSEDLDQRGRDSRKRKKSVSEDYVSFDISEEEKAEENADKRDNKFKDGAEDVQYGKKSKEVSTTKDRNTASSSLPALSSFRIPKKKVTHIGESKTQEQNSVLLRRGESSATPKPVGYFSKKQLSTRSKKSDFKEKERHNARHIKNETKPGFPAQQPIVEGWAKRAPPPPYGRGYHPQPGFPTMPVKTMSPSSGTHLGPGYSNKPIETTVNQHKMQLSSHERQHMTAKTDYSNMPCSQFGGTSSDQPVWSINVPPPPQLEKLDLSSLLKLDSGNIQKTPYESSPVMSYGNSSDGESDVTETGKTSSGNRQKTQPPLTSVTDSPNIDVTNIYKANSFNAQPPTKEIGSPNVEVTQVNKANVSSAQHPLSNVSGISNINISETCKANVSSVQSSQSNSNGTPDTTTTAKASDPSSEEMSSHVKEMDSKVAASKSTEPFRDKLEAREGTSKDHYQNLDKRQKIKLYEKRKRYYHESRRKFYAEKGDKKHFWYKEYEKRKREYYHLKLYLYKEKKREQMAKIHKESQNSQDDRVDKTIASTTVESELSTEPESPKQKEKSCKSVVEEEIPYSPTGSPIAYDDIDVSKSLLDEPSKKMPTDIKEQEINLNYPADKLKETLMQILKAINQESSNVKDVTESQSRDTEVNSKKTESAKANEELHTSEPTSPCSSPPKTSESFLALKTTESFLSPSSSLPLPLKEILLPSSVPSPLLGKTPVQVSQPSSKALPQDFLTVPFSSTCTPPLPVSAPQSLPGTITTPPLPVPPPQTIAGFTSTPPLPVPPPHPIPVPIATPPLPVPPPQSSNSGKNSSCPNIERKVDLPIPALPLKSFLGDRPHPGIPDEHSSQKSLPKYVPLPPLPSSPAPPQPGQESTKEMFRYIQDSYLSSVTPGDETVPPLPPPPLPPLIEKSSESYNANRGGLGEITITDDTTEVPMDIDSDEDNDSERYDCHDNFEDRYESSGCQDNNTEYKKVGTMDCLDSDEVINSERYDCHDTYEGKYESFSCQDNNKEYKKVETLDCLDNTDCVNETENSYDKEGSKGHEGDRDFLALFGIYDKSPALEKEADSESTGDQKITTLVRKLMNVTSTRKPVDEDQGIGHASVEEISTTSALEIPSSGFHPLAHYEKEMEDSDTSNEPKILPATNVDVSKEVSIVPEKDTPEMAAKEQEAEMTSLRPCSKENKKQKSSDGALGASLKGEIEIITPKEPPKNLICVDEILLSVEAADQPTDLQIIYADLRKTSREKPNIIRDEVPKYYQKTALAQMLVDKCKDIPLVGLQYVLEVRKDFNNTLDGCYYICAVCSKKMTAHTLVAHIKSMPHRLKFSETHCKHIFDKYSSYDIKEWTAPLVKTFTVDLAEVEKKMGRHKLAVAFEREISSVLKSLKQNISEISSLSRLQEEKTKVSEAPTQSKSTVSATTTSISVKEVEHPNTDKSGNQAIGAHASSSVNIPSKNQNVGAHAVSKANIPLPSKSAGPRANTNNKNNDGYFENEEDEVLILPQEKKPTNTKKFSSNGQGFTKRNYRPGPNFRRRSKSRSSTPSLSPVKTRSRSRSKSRSLSPKRNLLHSPPSKLRKHSKSPPRRKPDRRSPQRRSPQRHGLERPGSDRHHLPGRKRKHSRSPVSPHHSRSRSRSRDIRKRYRSRSRSRSRHRSPTHRKREGWTRHSPPPKRDSTEEGKRRAVRRRLQEFREVEMKIKARHRNLMIVYEKAPETHPLYNREWKLFWERRCRELEKEGLDPFLYNFKREWALYWHHRMKELIDQNLKEKRDALLRKFKIEDPDLEESKLYDGSKPPGSLKKHDNVGAEKVSRIDRSPSPWEEDGPAIGRNPSPTPEEIMNTAEGKYSSKSNESSAAKFEDDFSVIGTLKLLNELEDQLGSFGPAITTLLGKAVDCSQKGEDTLELFNDPDNLVLVRYAREKLSSQISAGILGVAALVKTQMAVERSMWLQSQAEKLANEGKYLGLDIAGIAKATLGRDTVQIAQYIAQHLLQVGKSNASENDLQSILYAVLAAHTKLLVETSKKAQMDTPVTEGTTPVSTPRMPPASSDPPKELPDAPSESPEDAKQPLFPSTVPGKSRDGDSMEGDKGSSFKLSGGLEFLQNSYDEENGKEMENLSLDDLRSLLSNFNSLSTEEKQALTAYLKKLEATDSKKVTKLREEIQKSARNAPKASNVKLASKSGKSAARPQGTTHTDSNSQLDQQQLLGASQMSTPEGKVPLTQEGEDRRPHSKDSASQPPLASPLKKNFMANSKEADGRHDSKGIAGPSGGQDPTCNMPPTVSGVRNMPPSSLDPPSHNLPPSLGRMGEMAQDFGPGVLKPDRMDQPVFDKGHNRPFPQQTFMDRQGPGSDSELLLGQNNPMGPDGPDRFDRPSDARFDRLGEGRFDRPGEPRFDGPGEPRYGGPGDQRFDRPGERRFDVPGEPRFDGPGGPRFDRPSEARFDGPKDPNFDRMGEERFGGPGEPRFSGPGEHRYDMPGPSRFDGPGGFNGPDGPGRPGFDRQGDSRFGRPGEPYNSQWDGFGRGGPAVDDRAFPPQDENYYQWYDKGSQGPPEPSNFGPRGRARAGWSGRPFRGMPGRGLHSNTRQPYREPW